MMVVMQVLDGNCGHCKGDLVLYFRRKRWRYETRRDEAESQTWLSFPLLARAFPACESNIEAT